MIGIIYESPSIRLLIRGDGENHYDVGYGHYYCNSYNEYIGHGNGYYHYVNYPPDSLINNFNLIYNV